MSTPKMRAKFQLQSVEKVGESEYASERLKFSAVGRSDNYPADGSDENNTFSKFTPSATCEMYVANPALHGQFEVGQKYYVDFTPAE